ncbi:hypothetical protein CEUSTIGMA_g772.t1 [Chlamydomonas eustigma]|uniref:TRP C-terminal domain-containing protein n=1 Tax=Chlamydomonas eustigma TaxID=1157962 RepID=A0A250WR70_9CHLO|nr:hypothetical protein CEUSTIGMA_g772.t1 [Chlamydomonas eustigma]|eukprot:GAX73318.1 hypothetical protein CEUSTIGMA_g772.t1 [Chlamydomonas eustigma]
MHCSSTFNNNTAYSSAGAVECVSCSALAISNSIFQGNSALSAGALSMSYVLSGSVTNSTFVTNKAQTQVSTMNCGRDLSGGGGAVCVAIQGAVVFNDCLFKSNFATNGGGIWVYRTCNPSTDATCGSVSLLAPTFLNNTARGGGGGGIYTYDSSEVTYTCPSSTANSSLGGLNMGCISWLGNNATYGPLVATTAVSLSVVTPASSNVSDYNSDSSLPVLIAVKDAFNQTITGGSMESSASFSCTGVTTAPSGITVVSSSAGLASYTGLALRATPGTYLLSFSELHPNTFLNFSVSGTYHTLQPVSIQVNIRNCLVGEITTLQHDLCTYCAGDTYSFNPANISCDKCDTSLETCDFNKSATNTIGSILVPLNGNWHSSPWSPQVQSCPLADACSYDARQSDILAFQDALYYGTITVFSNGTLVNATAAAAYQELQCAPGYQGILCSDCQPMYGRTGASQCSICPNIALNNIYYILSSLISVIMVSITIRGQLLSRGAEDEEEKDQEDEEVREKRDKEADMEMDADLAVQQAQQDLSEIAPMLRTEGGDAPDKRVPLGEVAEDIQLEVSPRSKDAELQEKYVEDYTPDYHQDQVEDPVSKTRVSKGIKFSGAAEGANEEEDGEDNYLEVLDRKRKMAEPEDEDNALEMNDSKISAETPAIVMKILVSYLQVASIIHFMAIKWPSAVTSMLSVSDQVSNGASTLVSLDCSLTDTHIPKSVQRSIISVCLPIVLLLLSVPTWLLIYAYGKHKQQADIERFHALLLGSAQIEEALHPWLRYRMTVTLLSIIFFSYPGVTNTLLSFFNCPTVDDASAGLPYVDYLMAPGRYWASDYNLQCFTGYHNLLALYIGIPGVIFFSLGVPAFSAYFLYKNQHRLREKGFIRSYGFIYGDYRDECFYWESVVMLRKLLIILVVVFLVTYGNVMQVVVALGIIIVAMVVQMIMDPYRLERMEFLERISLYGNTLLLYLSLLYTQSTFTGTSQTILGLALVVVNVLVVAFLLFHYAREWLRGKISKLDRTNGGFVSEEDIVRAASKAKSMTALVAAKSMHSFYKWAKANPHREKLAAAIVPYGMFGAKPGENPDEVLNLGWSKSFTGMGARRGVMGRNASENNVGGGGGGSALSRSVVNMNLHGSRPGISASSPSAVIASQSSAEQSQVGTIMSKPSMRSVAMVSISDKQQLDQEGAGVSSGFGLKSEIAAALPSQDLIAFSPREGPRLGTDKAEQSLRGDHHSGVDDRLQLQGKSSLKLATASSLEVAGDHSVGDRALKTSHSSGPSGMSQSSAIGAAPLSNILRSSRVAPLPSSPHLPHFPQNS